MTGLDSVRSATPPQNNPRSAQETAANPIPSVEPPDAAKPLGQHGQMPAGPISNPENDVAKAVVPPDENTPTGPPPAFEASLLEIETNLEIVIKRVEAAREKARVALAVSPEPPWDQTDAARSTRPL